MRFNLLYRDWASVLNAGVYAEIYFESLKEEAIEFQDKKISDYASGTESGLGLRYLFQENEPGEIETVFGSANGINAGDARRLADRLLAGRKRTENPPGSASSFRNGLPDPDSNPISSERKCALLRRLDHAAREEHPEVSQVHISYSERSGDVAVFTSDGSDARKSSDAATLVISATASRKNLRQSATEVLGGPRGFRGLSPEAAVSAARRAARRAAAKLDAPVAQGGEMPVVLAASAGGTFIHEAVGHSLESDHIQEGASPHYARLRDKTVAPEFLSVFDDPTLPFARGSYPFDDEGRPAEPVAAIEGGVLKEFIYDRLTAMREGRSSNGHGRRESYRHRPVPRLSNLYIAPGPHDPVAIVKELDRGLLVTRMGGGEVHTATGEFVFGVDEGFRIENGKILGRVRDANLLGIGHEALSSVDRLGWDMGWSTGTCGKCGQGVAVSDGQPTMRIPKLLVGGRA